jgi:hypothetical protein
MDPAPISAGQDGPCTCSTGTAVLALHECSSTGSQALYWHCTGTGTVEAPYRHCTGTVQAPHIMRYSKVLGVQIAVRFLLLGHDETSQSFEFERAGVSVSASFVNAHPPLPALPPCPYLLPFVIVMSDIQAKIAELEAEMVRTAHCIAGRGRRGQNQRATSRLLACACCGPFELCLSLSQIGRFVPNRPVRKRTRRRTTTWGAFFFSPFPSHDDQLHNDFGP